MNFKEKDNAFAFLTHFSILDYDKEIKHYQKYILLAYK